MLSTWLSLQLVAQFTIRISDPLHWRIRLLLILDALLLWGLYAEYLEEAFKFLDRKKWYVSLLSEYSASEVDHIKEVRIVPTTV